MRAGSDMSYRTIIVILTACSLSAAGKKGAVIGGAVGAGAGVASAYLTGKQ